jgi:beta-glucosidase-like glycosyl hydrolase
MKVCREGVFLRETFSWSRDTDTDSRKAAHGQLSKQKLEVMEFYPYKKMFEEGLASVMVAFKRAEFRVKTNYPSSISYNVVTNVLQRNWAFKVLFLQML